MHLSLHRLNLYFKTRDGLLTQHSPTIGQVDSRTLRCLTIGLLDTAVLNNWTVWNGTVRPLDSWTKLSLTIGQLNTQLASHWTV